MTQDTCSVAILVKDSLFAWIPTLSATAMTQHLSPAELSQIRTDRGNGMSLQQIRQKLQRKRGDRALFLCCFHQVVVHGGIALVLAHMDLPGQGFKLT